MRGRTRSEFATFGGGARGVPTDADSGGRVGQLVGGRYELLRLIGTGGMGSVYEARHRDIHRRFAVKLLHTRHVTSPFGVMRFKREARVAATLDSEYVVSVLDWGEADDGTPFLAMEYLEGMSLRALLRREGQLAPVRAVNLVLDACLGTAVAHEAGVIHRDLKPENLFVTRGRNGKETVKVLDYGVAKLVGDAGGDLSTRSGQVLGTPSYMPPEQAADAATVDRGVDIYALGVVLFEALCGTRPAGGPSDPSSESAERKSIATEMAELLPDGPEGLCAVVCKALSPRPEDRFDSADRLARALAPFAGCRGTHGPALRSGSKGQAGTTLSDAPGEASIERQLGQRQRLWLWLVLGAIVAACVAVFAAAPRAVESAPSGAREPLEGGRPIGSRESQERSAGQPVAGTPSPPAAPGQVRAPPEAAAGRASTSVLTRPTHPSRLGASLGPARTGSPSGAARLGKPSRPPRTPSSARANTPTSAPAGFDLESPYAPP
jgi:tRNA A-37 threonylcarbamoyl transferase component Bud32